MIRNIKVQSGFAAELPQIKDRIFTFVDDRINVLYGANGTGKTTLLRIVAGYTGINTTDPRNGGGWSKSPRFAYGTTPKYPRDFTGNTIGNCVATVGWSGQPVFFNTASLSDTAQLTHFSGMDDSPDGITDIGMQIAIINGKRSEGEMRLLNIKRVAEALKKDPPKLAGDNKAYCEYVKGLRSKYPQQSMVILWDEPDRSLDVLKQKLFWTTFIPRLHLFGVQVIISSHSPILACITHPFYNIIEMETGYVSQVREALSSVIGWGPEQTLPELKKELKKKEKAK